MGNADPSKLLEVGNSLCEKLKKQMEELENMKLISNLPTKYMSKCDEFLTRVQGKNLCNINDFKGHPSLNQCFAQSVQNVSSNAGYISFIL